MRRSVTLPCGAVIDVVHYTFTLDGLRVSPGQAKAITEDCLPDRGNPCLSTRIERGRCHRTLSGVWLTRGEAEAMLAGAHPLEVLLPPGRLHAVPADMRELT